MSMRRHATNKISKLAWTRPALVASIACVLLAIHVSRRGSAPSSLGFEDFRDHYRHMRFAWEALRIGPRVYTVPLQDMARIGDPRAYTWMEFPYLYPPGALLFFMPFAALCFGGVIAPRVASDAMIFTFGVAAIVAAERLFNLAQTFASSIEARILWAASAACLLMTALGWGLHGQYDSVVVLVVLLAATTQLRSRRMMWLGLAFALKFQALLFLPFFAGDFAILLCTRRTEIRRDAPALAGIALTMLAIVTALFLAVHGLLAPMHASPLHLANVIHDRVTASCAALTVAVAFLACVRREWIAAFTVIWAFSAYAAIAQFQGWYIVYAFALAPFCRRGSTLVVVWALGFLYLLNWTPSFYRMLEELFVLAPG